MDTTISDTLPVISIAKQIDKIDQDIGKGIWFIFIGLLVGSVGIWGSVDSKKKKDEDDKKNPVGVGSPYNFWFGVALFFAIVCTIVWVVSSFFVWSLFKEKSILKLQLPS